MKEAIPSKMWVWLLFYQHLGLDLSYGFMLIFAIISKVLYQCLERM